MSDAAELVFTTIQGTVISVDRDEIEIVENMPYGRLFPCWEKLSYYTRIGLKSGREISVKDSYKAVREEVWG